MEFRIVDAHLHLWNVDYLTFPWLKELPDLNRSFDLDLFQLQSRELKYAVVDNKEEHYTKSLQLEKMIFIQCECLPSQYLDEVDYISRLATIDKRIQGIVSWFPLEKEGIEEELQELLKSPLIKGLRRLEEAPTSLFNNPVFIANLDLLSKYGLTFDICAKNNLLKTAIQLTEKKPDIKYMLDHMGKPDIKNKEITSWKENIRLLARNPNVYCKISGLVTEADLQNWTIDQLQPYFDHVLEHFGINRLVFGSDWPVLNLATSYQKWIDAVMILCRDMPEEALNKLFWENACSFYKLT